MRLFLPFALAVLAIVSIIGLQAALISSGEDITVDDETWTPNTGSYVALDDSNLDRAYYDNDTTVYNTTNNNGTEMEQGVDYEWNETDGTIKAVSGEGLDGATEANITYSYQRTTEEQERLAAMAAQLPRAVAVILPALAALVLLAFLKP